MFTVGGRNVYPAEIESALSAHPDVLSCLVVGVPHEDLGQVPHAIVQADGLDEAAVIAFLSDRLAGYKVPRKWSSATPRCATTQARPAVPRSVTRSSRDGRLRRVGNRTIKRRRIVPSLPAPQARFGTATRPARS